MEKVMARTNSNTGSGNNNYMPLTAYNNYTDPYTLQPINNSLGRTSSQVNSPVINGTGSNTSNPIYSNFNFNQGGFADTVNRQYPTIGSTDGANPGTPPPPETWNPTWDDFSKGAQGVGALGNLYLAHQGLGYQKKAFDSSKAQWNENFGEQRRMNKANYTSSREAAYMRDGMSRSEAETEAKKDATEFGF